MIINLVILNDLILIISQSIITHQNFINNFTSFNYLINLKINYFINLCLNNNFYNSIIINNLNNY